MSAPAPPNYIIQLTRTEGVDDPIDASAVSQSFYVSSVNPIQQIAKPDRRAGRVLGGLQEASDELQVKFWPFSWDGANAQSEKHYRILTYFLRSEYLYVVACNFPRYVEFWQSLTGFTSGEISDFDIYSLSALSGAPIRVKCSDKSEKISQVSQYREVTATLTIADPLQ